MGIEPKCEKKSDIYIHRSVLLISHLGRLVFHGKGFVLSYYKQKEETKPYIAWFTEERFGPKWLTHFEAALAQNNGGHG